MRERLALSCYFSYLSEFQKPKTNKPNWNASPVPNNNEPARPPAWPSRGTMAHAEAAGAGVARHTPFVRDQPKIKPNEPCYCGSGKKFKKCHGAGI